METVNYNFNDLHQIQMKLLIKLISLCTENHFAWYLGFGSLLGAVRDHKIISWDDAIDVVMPYPDYDKLTNLPQEVWGDGLFMQTYDTDPQYPRYYAKLRNSNTTLIKADYASYDINQGVYINIMPLVNLADDADERKRQFRDAKLYKALAEGQPLPGSEKSLRMYLSLLLASSDQKKRKMREELKAKVISFENEKTNDCFVLAGNVSLTLALPKVWFESAVEWDFEGIKVNIPKGWHQWLSVRYGDYMVAPITDLQGDKVSKFITLNTQRPYTDYKGKTYCVEQGKI